MERAYEARPSPHTNRVRTITRLSFAMLRRLASSFRRSYADVAAAERFSSSAREEAVSIGAISLLLWACITSRRRAHAPSMWMQPTRWSPDTGPMSAVMFVPSLVCGCLAYWQYERMEWKVRGPFVLGARFCEVPRPDPQTLSVTLDLTPPPQESLIKQRSEGLMGEAKDVFGAAELQEYDKVSATGVFLDNKSVFIGPRPRKCEADILSVVPRNT